jgi:hypothetical protein
MVLLLFVPQAAAVASDYEAARQLELAATLITASRPRTPCVQCMTSLPAAAAAAAVFAFNPSQAAAVVSDFEAARQLELAKVVSSLAATRAAGDAAAQAWLESR